MEGWHGIGAGGELNPKRARTTSVREIRALTHI
jgi:hypothetical protein